MCDNVLLGRYDTIRSNAGCGFQEQHVYKFYICPAFWTFEQNINFIHKIVHCKSKCKILCIVRDSVCLSKSVAYTQRLQQLPLLKYAMQNLKNIGFYDALLNELFRDTTGLSMFAIELNILLGFGYTITNVRRESCGLFVFEMKKLGFWERLLG